VYKRQRVDGAQVVGGDIVSPDAYLLTVSGKGFGKLTLLEHYSVHKRGGKGLRAHRASDKIGKIVAAKLVNKDEGYLVMLAASGNIVRIPIKQVSVQSRNGRGVRLMVLSDDDEVVSIATL